MGSQPPPRMHVVTGTHRHHSVDRAVRVLGIGSKHLHLVPTTADRLDVRALAALLDRAGGASRWRSVSLPAISTPGISLTSGR